MTLSHLPLRARRAMPTAATHAHSILPADHAPHTGYAALSRGLRLGAMASAATALALLLSGCETTNMRMGSADAKTVATGSAAGGATAGASDSLERCESPLGTVSLVENQQAGWYTILRDQYRLPPTANLLRLLVHRHS